MSAADEEFGPVKGTRSLPPFLSLARRTRYALYQGSRVALYTLHSEAMRRMNRDLQKQLPETPKVVPTGPVPSQRRMLSDIVKLFADDLKSVEDGIYPLPSDGTMTPGELISTSRAFFKDVPEVARRRASGAHQEVNSTEGFAAALPRYYRQNFHFQTDGWLSEESARLYDFQVDVLFSGATAAMRRRALVPFARILRRKDQRHVSYLDIACGTGGLLRPALAAFPRLKGTGLDLSEPYLNVARERLPSRRASYICGLAETLPFADNSLDVVSCVFLFHELPPKIRRQVVSEVARVLKPGGSFLFVDSLQTGDVPEYDGLLSVFPQLFHEPYFTSYLNEDLTGIAKTAGLEESWMAPAFVSRVAEFIKSD
ncbi:Demethylmenaquinone methyltransferase [Labrenzia sp. THAF191b]|uniref:class I SAM-dependent methyltransferase n=1 Tax=unclassified Labrenzia TaxID=2648686 RepID=UPI001268FEA4|nr:MULTISPECIES: class I SAM-dependent methyltransferase [unclassified Labrenzia]QFT01334.1 Demethylmenaquinone methyltransferase [Labrenzia sp. THAF191b]QFT07647.1 Demethylmenaquinone methyltransferase [Labrenzia sp. THAF191a]QFT19191.1 Demethylmenaquinone methyltransferase [Labrenzia sp. THAF187b]